MTRHYQQSGLPVQFQDCAIAWEATNKIVRNLSMVYEEQKPNPQWPATVLYLLEGTWGQKYNPRSFVHLVLLSLGW